MIVEDSRATLLTADIVGSLVHLLDSSDEGVQATCLHLLSELVEYSMTFYSP